MSATFPSEQKHSPAEDFTARPVSIMYNLGKCTNNCYFKNVTTTKAWGNALQCDAITLG